jgi:glycosyltransferase involved in cell wall biosynthesis
LAKRGLIVCYYFPPSGGGGVQRWVKFIKYLSRLNWQFTVITAPVEPNIPGDESLGRELPESTRVIRIPDPGGSSRVLSSVKRKLKPGYWQRWFSAFIHVTDSRIRWNRHVRKVLPGLLESSEFDCVIVSSPPYSLSMLAAAISQRYNIPVILDLRDPWTTNPYKIYPSAMHRYIDQMREKKNIGKLDYMISVYSGTFDHFRRILPSFTHKKCIVLPNGYDEEDFQAPATNEKIKAEGFNLGFSGTFYSHLNRPDSLFAAIGLLKKEGITIHFHHFGQTMIDLKKLGHKYGIADLIRLWNYVDHTRVIGRLKQMDAFCMILDPDAPAAGNTVGGKLYEYLYFKKPVLAIVPENGEAARIIRNTDAGLVVGTNDVRSIADAIRKLAAGDISLNFTNTEIYNRKDLAKQLDAFLTGIIERSGS